MMMMMMVYVDRTKCRRGDRGRPRRRANRRFFVDELRVRRTTGRRRLPGIDAWLLLFFAWGPIYKISYDKLRKNLG